MMIFKINSVEVEKKVDEIDHYDPTAMKEKAERLKQTYSTRPKETPESETKKNSGYFSDEVIAEVAQDLGINFDNVDFTFEQFKKGINVEREHSTDPALCGKIALDHLKEMSDYYERLAKMEEKQNAKNWAKTYKAKFIEKGVCAYEDETVYLDNTALFSMMQSMKGRPVLIHHQHVTPENMEEHAVGYVADVEHINGEFIASFVVFDEEAKSAIADGYSVSCAYKPTEFGQGGTWHNVVYNREILNGEYTHLALVPDPRYEDAVIYENSKNKGETIVFKLFKQKTEELQNTNAVVELENGVQVSLETLVAEYKNSKAEEEKEEEKLNMDDEVEVDGEKVKVNALVEAYKNAMKKNSEEEEKENSEEESEEESKENESDDEEEKENESEEDKKDFEDIKENSKKLPKEDLVIRAWSQVKGAEDGKNLM